MPGSSSALIPRSNMSLSDHVDERNAHGHCTVALIRSLASCVLAWSRVQDQRPDLPRSARFKGEGKIRFGVQSNFLDDASKRLPAPGRTPTGLRHRGKSTLDGRTDPRLP